MLLRAFLIIVLMVPFAARAADPLSEKDVLGFLDAAEAMQGLEDKYPDTDLDFTSGENGIAMMDKMFAEDGTLQIMDLFIEKARSNSALYNDFSGIVKTSGFSSNDEFADVGDRVIMAMARSEISPDDIAQMEQARNIPEAQMAMIPEKMRGTLKKALRFADALKEIPESDVSLVQKHRARFEALGD